MTQAVFTAHCAAQGAEEERRDGEDVVVLLLVSLVWVAFAQSRACGLSALAHVTIVCMFLFDDGSERPSNSSLLDGTAPRTENIKG